MPRIPTERQTLTDPPVPPTDIRASYRKLRQREWVMVDVTGPREAWIEVDDQHVWQLEDLE